MRIDDDRHDELIRFLLSPERHERNILKLCEEMAELSEVLLKYVNKTPENRPSKEKIVEELGDVLFRSLVVIEQFDIAEQVDTRIDEKTAQVYDWYEGKISNEKEEVV